MCLKTKGCGLRRRAERGKNRIGNRVIQRCASSEVQSAGLQVSE